MLAAAEVLTRRCCRWFIGVLGLLSLLSFPVAVAAPSEPILFLGIQRHTAIDRLATLQLGEYLTERGEHLQNSANLKDAERRCRHPQCLEALATDHHAALILSGDVSATGPNNTLRVQIRLYDHRRRGSSVANLEMENLCIDCDETKLGILLATTTGNLIDRYHAQNPAAAPSAVPPAPVPEQIPPPPLPVEAPSQEPVSPPVLAVPPLPEISATPPANGMPTTPEQQVYPPVYYPPAEAQNTTAAPPSPRRGLSRARRGVAAAFGVLGFGSLLVAAVMTGLDHRLAPDYSYNPGGRSCNAPENAGKVCVLSTVGLYAPMYAVGGLLVGGMILTLAIPESHPRPPSSDLEPTY